MQIILLHGWNETSADIWLSLLLLSPWLIDKVINIWCVHGSLYGMVSAKTVVEKVNFFLGGDTAWYRKRGGHATRQATTPSWTPRYICNTIISINSLICSQLTSDKNDSSLLNWAILLRQLCSWTYMVQICNLKMKAFNVKNGKKINESIEFFVQRQLSCLTSWISERI